jgi:hypothetical protein
MALPSGWQSTTPLPRRRTSRGFTPGVPRWPSRSPILRSPTDGGLIIRVDNPANVVKLMTEKGKRTESLLHLDVEDVRKEGNRCFREQNWDAAAEHYTKCIDAALLQLKERSSNGNNNIITCLLHAYSNRAETRLQAEGI